MVAASRLLVVSGAVVTAEDATLCFYRITGTDNTNTIVAGTLYHFDIDAHDYSSCMWSSGSRTWSIMLVSMVRT